MQRKKLIIILVVCLVLAFVGYSAGTAMGYFNDAESSVNNTLRIAESW